MMHAGDLVAEINATKIHQHADSHIRRSRENQSDIEWAPIQSVRSDRTVEDALMIMMAQNTAALLVLEEQQLIGIVSKRDYVDKVVRDGASPDATRVSEIMSRTPCRIDSDTTVEDCMVLAREKRVQFLCVVDGDRTLGLISILDIEQALTQDREQRIRDLKFYIHSSSQLT